MNTLNPLTCSSTKTIIFYFLALFFFGNILNFMSNFDTFLHFYFFLFCYFLEFFALFVWYQRELVFNVLSIETLKIMLRPQFCPLLRNMSLHSDGSVQYLLSTYHPWCSSSTVYTALARAPVEPETSLQFKLVMTTTMGVEDFSTDFFFFF